MFPVLSLIYRIPSSRLLGLLLSNCFKPVWSGVKDLGVFTKDTLIPIAEKVAEHKEAIIGSVAASVAAVKTIP